jgi:hypothetical protein
MAAVSSAVSRCFFKTNQIAAAATTTMMRMGPRRELFSGDPEGGPFETRERASAFAAARASGVSLRVCASGLLARETRGSSGSGRGVTDGCFGSAGFSGGGGSEPEGGVAFAGSLGVVFGSMTGAAMPISVLLPGRTTLAVATGGRLLVAGSAGTLLGLTAGLSLGLSLGLSVTTCGAGIPMSVPPRAAVPSGRVVLVARAPPVAAGVLGDSVGTLDDVAGRGGPLAGFGGTLEVVAGGVLAGRGGSLAALLVGAASAGFG